MYILSSPSCVFHNCPLCDVFFAGADIDVLCVAPRLIDREQFTNGFADELRHLDGVRDLRVRALSQLDTFYSSVGALVEQRCLSLFLSLSCFFLFTQSIPEAYVPVIKFNLEGVEVSNFTGFHSRCFKFLFHCIYS